MAKQFRKTHFAIHCTLSAFLWLIVGLPADAADRKSFNLAVSVYAGWMPWYYAKEQGILKKWSDRYSCDIDVKYMDYVQSVEQFVAGHVDAVAMTNIETLDMPAASGVDSSVIIIGDFSNGNDAILTREKISLSDLKGKTVHLAERTVSHYLLDRALETAGLRNSDVKIVNVSDSDIPNLANKSKNVVVTWNPMVMELEKLPGTTRLFDSSRIPGEIQDLLVVNTNALKTNPDLARALTGAWFEVLEIMNRKDPSSDKAIEKMASLAKTSPAEFKAQLKTTSMFYTSRSALDDMRAPDLKAKQERVRKFCFAHGLLGENARSADVVGIAYPDGTIFGDKKNIKMRYVDTFLKEHADGKIKAVR